MNKIVLTSIDEIVQAVPAMLGFYPTRSFIAVLLTDTQPAVIRIDLHETGAAEDYWAPIGLQLRTRRITALIVIVVADEMETHRALIEDLSHRARAAGLALPVAVWTAQITAGGPWRSYLDAGEGRVPDPTTALLAITTVGEGSVIYPSREAAADTFTTTASAEALALRARLIEQRIAALDTNTAIRTVLDTVNDATLPHGHEQFASLTAALSNSRARDAAITAMDFTDLDPAIRLWHHVLRNVAPPHQGHIAVPLAIAYLLNNDGLHAGVALDLACEQLPRYELPKLLRAAMATGMDPTEFRQLITSAVR